MKFELRKIIQEGMIDVDAKVSSLAYAEHI